VGSRAIETPGETQGVALNGGHGGAVGFGSHTSLGSVASSCAEAAQGKYLVG